MFPNIVATLAPIMNCIQLFPQLYKTYQTKSVNDLSVYSLYLILFTSLIWLIHGYFIYDMSLLIAGLINVAVNVLLLVLFYIYRNKSRV